MTFDPHAAYDAKVHFQSGVTKRLKGCVRVQSRQHVAGTIHTILMQSEDGQDPITDRSLVVGYSNYDAHDAKVALQGVRREALKKYLAVRARRKAGLMQVTVEVTAAESEALFAALCKSRDWDEDQARSAYQTWGDPAEPMWRFIWEAFAQTELPDTKKL